MLVSHSIVKCITPVRKSGVIDNPCTMFWPMLRVLKFSSYRIGSHTLVGILLKSFPSKAYA